MNAWWKQTWSRLAPAAKIAAWAAVFFSACLATLRADDLPPPLTLTVPVPANLATPAWLGHPVTPNDTLATLDLPITPPDPNASLLVTIYFTEVDNGFLRINWNPDSGTALQLSSNFFENIGMTNARSLLIAPSTLGTGGTLMLQGNTDTLGVQRIKFEWLESRQDLVSPAAPAMLITTADGKTVTADSVNGQPAPEPTAGWDGDVVSVPVIAEPVRIEQGVDFSVQLDTVPTNARIVLKESGLSLNQRFVVWLNQQRAGTLTPAVPRLTDAGFFTDPSSSTSYIGWRDGSFYVPVALLKAGVNTLQFSPEDDAHPANSPSAGSLNAPPLALKDLAIQMNYVAPPEPPPVDLPVLHLSAQPAPLTSSDSNSSP